MGSYNGYEIRERFEYTCVYCLTEFDSGMKDIGKKLNTDHVIPKSRKEEYGLSSEEIDEDWNLVASCSLCNNKRKKDMKPEDFFDKVPQFRDNFRDNLHVSDKIKGLLGLLGDD